MLLKVVSVRTREDSIDSIIKIYNQAVVDVCISFHGIAAAGFVNRISSLLLAGSFTTAVVIDEVVRLNPGVSRSFVASLVGMCVEEEGCVTPSVLVERLDERVSGVLCDLISFQELWPRLMQNLSREDRAHYYFHRNEVMYIGGSEVQVLNRRNRIGWFNLNKLIDIKEFFSSRLQNSSSDNLDLGRFFLLSYRLLRAGIRICAGMG
jgi:hypothetical protein